MTSMSACDKLTMDTMINVAAYSKYMARKETDTKIRSSETKSERRFYKKRILELTKQLIKNPAHTNDSTVINTCNAYINACIVHFKFVDLSETLQMEHVDDNSNTAAAAAAASFSTTDAMDAMDVLNKVNEIDTAFLSEDARNVKKISIPEKNVLEQLFISPESKTQTKTITPETSNHIPRIVEIDFKDKHFKTKGVKKSKMKHSGEN
jgi:hypothetical protein